MQGARFWHVLDASAGKVRPPTGLSRPINNYQANAQPTWPGRWAKRCALAGGNGLRGIVKGLNREGVHLHDEDPTRAGERSVKDRKAGVKGWTIFSRPLSVIARAYPITPGLFSEISRRSASDWSCSKS